MRRAIVLVGFAIAVLSSCGSPSDERQWIVAVHAEDERTFDDSSCFAMEAITGLQAATSEGAYNGILTVSSRADGDAVARCYVGLGAEAEVRTMTNDDRKTWDELSDRG